MKYQKKWSDYLPILWKRNIRNVIENNHHYALKTFYKNFKQGNNRKQMKYGLELLLPESLHLILSSLNSIDSSDEVIAFLELLATTKFLTHVQLLKENDQELILSQIFSHWGSKSIKKKKITSLLKNLDPHHVSLLYSLLGKNNSNSSITHILEILTIWGSDILSNTLQLFLETPNDHIISFFRELSPKERTETIKINIGDKSLSKTRFSNLLLIVTPSEPELELLFEIQSVLPIESKKLLINWLIERNISSEILIKLFKSQKEEKSIFFVVEFIKERINKYPSEINDEIIVLLTSDELKIAHKIIQELNRSKKYNVAKILLSIILCLEKKVSEFTDFFYAELKPYAKNEIKRYLSVYLNTIEPRVQQILQPIIQENASTEWKLILNTIAEIKTDIPNTLITSIFNDCESKIKTEIGQYIIQKSWISILSFLFQDFFIFKSILLSNKEISLSEQAILEPLLKNHLKDHFNAIILLGNKITYPKLVFTSLMDKKYLINLLEILVYSKSNIELLHYWEEVILARADDAIPLILEKVTDQGIDEKNVVFELLMQLINLESNTFWNFIQKTSINKLPNFRAIIIHYFKGNISNLPIVLSQLSKTHINFIFNEVFPVSSRSDSNTLFSLLSIEDTKQINEDILKQAILELIKLNQEEFLSRTLVRCSKAKSNPRTQNFFSNISKDLMKIYPEDSLKTIDSNKLTSLTQEVQSNFSSLKNEELEALIRKTIPNIQSGTLTTIFINNLQRILKIGTNVSLLNSILFDYEINEYTTEGEKLLIELYKSLIGKSHEFDLILYQSLLKKTKSQSLLLEDYFLHISLSTVENIILNPEIDVSERKIIKSIIKLFETNPPDNAEDYFFSFYQKIEKTELKKAIIPLLGKFCSWPNLSSLINLSEKNKYKSAYNESLNIFVSRFNIQSARALEKIWEAGLKDVYTQKSVSKFLQSQCPQCGNPILEKQQNCGFCTQRLTCAICLQSVVKLERKDVIRCPHCDNFFHRDHLIESIKLNNRCPVCNVKLNAREILSLPNYEFFFH